MAKSAARCIQRNGQSGDAPETHNPDAGLIPDPGHSRVSISSAPGFEDGARSRPIVKVANSKGLITHSIIQSKPILRGSMHAYLVCHGRSGVLSAFKEIECGLRAASKLTRARALERCQATYADGGDVSKLSRHAFARTSQFHGECPTARAV